MILVRIGVLGWLAGLTFLPSLAHAFPEMVRYGYVNCNSCHISLTGGGLLNDYGREISREKLALFKSADEKSEEQLFAYGAISDTDFAKYVKAGGDIRSVYYYINDDTKKLAKTQFMQGDAEVALVLKKLTVDGTLGVEQPIPGKNVDFISRRHTVQYALTDELNVRAGKYFPAYGINTPDHITLTRDPLGLGQGRESYNLELSYITENWSVFATGILGRYDDQQSTQDRGGAVMGTFSPNEHMKLGANVWYGEQPKQHRVLLGPIAMIGLTNKLYLQSEIDFQLLRNPVTRADPNGVASTQKLSYELLEGLWVYGQQEYGKTNFNVIPTQAETYSLGVEVFPRSHFDFTVSYERARQGGGDQNFYDYAFFMSHFYL